MRSEYSEERRSCVAESNKGKKLRSDFRKLHCTTGCRDQPAALLSAANFNATLVDDDTEGLGRSRGCGTNP